jgi:serine O-acetyltransferase
MSRIAKKSLLLILAIALAAGACGGDDGSEDEGVLTLQDDQGESVTTTTRLSADEAVFCYPGLMAITNYRLAHELHLLGVPLIPRIITEMAHSETGIDIHPRAEIDEYFSIDHGTGVVIGSTSVIGKNVKLYQGVTLGAKSFPLDENGNPIKGIPRHPIVEDNVVVYSNATVLGRITIGHDSVIGGNVWVTNSLPPHSKVVQVKSRQAEFVDGSGI